MSKAVTEKETQEVGARPRAKRDEAGPSKSKLRRRTRMSDRQDTLAAASSDPATGTSAKDEQRRKEILGNPVYGVKARLVGDADGSGSTSTNAGSDPQRQASSSSRLGATEAPFQIREHSEGSSTTAAANVDLASVEAEFAANYSIDLSRVTSIRFRDRPGSQEVDSIFIFNDGESTVADRLSFQEQVELENYLEKRKDKHKIERLSRTGGTSYGNQGTMENRMFRQESETMMLKDKVDKIYYSPGMPGAIEAQEEYNARRRMERNSRDSTQDRKRGREDQDKSYYSMREGHVIDERK